MKIPPCPYSSHSYLALGVLQNHYRDTVPDSGGGCPPHLAWATLLEGRTCTASLHVPPSRADVSRFGFGVALLWQSHLEAKPVWLSVSLQVITFSEIWGRECWWFSSAFWLPHAGLGPVEAKVDEAHLRRECLETSAQVCAHFPVELTSFCYDHGVRSEALYQNSAFQRVKCSCSSGSGKPLQFDLR